MQITGMGVELLRLFANRIDNMRMTMTHMGHVIIAIKIFSPARIINPSALAFDQMQWLVIKQPYIGSEKFGPAIKKILVLRRHQCWFSS